MKKSFVITILFLSCTLAKAQIYLMNNTGVALVCPSTSTFVDSGNSGGPYAANENFMKTFTAPVGRCLQVVFKNVDIEACCDILNIHDGPNTLAPLLGSLATTAAGPFTYVSSGNTLSFGFASDLSVQGAGWQATITCVAPCAGAPAPGVISLATSTAGCATSGPATLNCAGGTLGCGITYQWQSAPAASGPWTNISGANNGSSASVSYIGQTFFRKVACCGASCANSNTISVGSGAAPASCDLSTYTGASVTYSFDVFAGTTCPNTDDVLYSNIAMFGFNFCYTGGSYAGGYIASNGTFVFAGVPCFPNVYFNQMAAAGIGTGYGIDQPAPSYVNGTSSTPQNSVLGPWHDLDPSVPGGTIRYGTLGVAPNRRFVVSFENVPMFSCNAKDFSGQIKLFETSNNIEIHVKHKVCCAAWNNGEAIMGLTSFDGSTYIPPVNATAHNAMGVAPYNQWTMTNTAYRFTSPCASGGPCVVLPVDFKKFYGERKDRINHLYWETAQEENIKYFAIERSADATSFTELAKVTPNNAASKYQFDDVTTAPGTLNYYRVTAVDIDGSRKSTNIVILGANDGEIAVSGIYPNPVKTDFTMSVESKLITDVTVNIYDAVGKLVKSVTQGVGTGISQINLYVDELTPGIYILETINTNKEVVAKQKMIKVN